MGLDLEARFDVTTAGVDLPWLLSRVEAVPAPFAAAAEHTARYRRESGDWEITRLGEDDVLIGAPCILELDGDLLVATYGLKFRYFACLDEARASIRCTTRILADLVGSDRAIYTHEVMPVEGSTLAAIEASLRVTFESPAEDFDALCEAGEFKPHGWYIDTFADLRAT